MNPQKAEEPRLLTERINSPDVAAEIIRQGGLVAFPTETVFGLGADASNPTAVEKLFKAKGRPSDNPLIVHVSDASCWSLAASTLTLHAEKLLSAFAPGPITVVLPKRNTICTSVTAGLETVGVRVPNHDVAREILKRANVPVAAPSANRSGRPSGTRWRSVLEDLDGHIDAVYCEDSEQIGIESTVVDCCGPVPVLLRPGAVTLDQIRGVVPEAREMEENAHCQTARVNSPGLLHPHYQPHATVRLIETPTQISLDRARDVAYCGCEEFEGIEKLALYKVFSSLDEYAAGFYEFLRMVDRQSLSEVYVQLADNVGIGRALRDRQRRAAS